MSFHFEDESVSIFYGFTPGDIADVPAGRPGVVALFAPSGACFCYVVAASDTRQQLLELLILDKVPGLHDYLTEHGGVQFLVEETDHAEARARELIAAHRPLFNDCSPAEIVLDELRTHLNAL